MSHEQAANKTIHPVPHSRECLSCGATIAENYCGHCGEKKFDSHDLTVKHLAEETFEGFTHFDSKFFKSIKVLVARPGQLSVDFCNGKRVPYMRPFALFFVCNILFFLMAGNSNIFSQNLSSFYNYDPYVSLGSRALVEQKVKNEQEFIALAKIFNHQMNTSSKTFLALFIPVLALLGLLQRRRLIAEHLVFHTHFFAFVVLFYLVLTVVISLPYNQYVLHNRHSSTFDLVVSGISTMVTAVYYFMAVQRFYRASIVRAGLSTLAMTILFTAALYAYRMALFYQLIHVKML
ncbi:MAG: DUF3667 domain-containing protein [Pedobacter sp.]|nr:DUF3667 domain-containing protein [Pedobacter sp.]MDQ8053046.1 DUF3667 domain-containing protein [Pedobacter sp.]